MKRPKLPLAIAMLLSALALMLSPPALAQPRPGPPVLVAHPLTGGVYWISGDAANAGFIVGKDSVVVIDTQRSTDAARVQLARIAEITAKPVRSVIVTHGDPDHVGGLMAYPAGTAIIAHENIRAQILATARAPDGASPFLAAYRAIAAERLPNRTIAATEKLTIDGIAMTLLHVGPAHSSGDIVVFLPKQKVVFLGDVLTPEAASFPIIHNGGSSQGWIATVRAALALKADTFVAGHGGVVPRAEIQALLRQVEERREAVKAMVLSGKSIAEINAALPEAKVNPMFLSFNETTYFELTEGYPDALPPWASLGPADHRRRSAVIH